MTDLLDHAVTVRDVLYFFLALFILTSALIGWAVWVTNPVVQDRKRMAESPRNPAYGVEK